MAFNSSRMDLAPRVGWRLPYLYRWINFSKVAETETNGSKRLEGPVKEWPLYLYNFCGAECSVLGCYLEWSCTIFFWFWMKLYMDFIHLR